MKNVLNYSNWSDFLKNVLTLLSGTVIAQAISIILIPFLYRLYSIDDYGTFGVYAAILAIMNVFSTLHYTNTIILESTHEKALHTFHLNRFINLAMTIIVIILVLVFDDVFTYILNAPKVEKWLCLIPVSFFFLGQSQILRTWANRTKQYKRLRLNSILTALIIPMVSLFFGFIYNGWILGLFAGLLTGQIVPTIILFIQLNENRVLKYHKTNYSIYQSLLKKYANYPKYSLPSDFISSFSIKLPVFFLSTYFGPSVVGLFDLSSKVLGIPSTIISGAIRDVYKEKASSDFNETGSFKTVFLSILKPLSILSIVGFGILVIIAPDVFVYIFGESKREAGFITQVMALVYSLRFINTPLSYGFEIRHKQHIGLYGSIWFLLSSSVVFYLSFLNSFDYLLTLTIFAVNFGAIYGIMMVYNYKISTK